MGVVTLRTVHTLSTYELRQELVRRDAFQRFFPKEENVCYDTLLRASVQLLREDEERADAERFASAEREQEVTKARIAAEKAERKAAAEARSRERVQARNAAAGVTAIEQVVAVETTPTANTPLP